MVLPRSIQSPVNLAEELLDRGYEAAAGHVIRAISANATTGLMAQRLAEFEAEAARLHAANQPFTITNPIFRALIADLDDMLTRDALLMDGAAEAVQGAGIDASGQIVRQLALPLPDDIFTIGMQWNHPSADAIARVVQYASSDAWAAELDRYQTGTRESVLQAVIRGIVGGQNPVTTAREVRQLVEGMPAFQASNLLRTLQLQSYRDAGAVHRQANSHILAYQIRIASLDDRCCFLAGTKITTSNGLKSIEDVRVADRVLTHTGVYHPVVNLIRRSYTGAMITLCTQSARLTATANHPVLVERAGNRYWIPAEDCQVGDVVFIRREDCTNEVNHIERDPAIERHIGNTDNNKSIGDKPSSLTPIAFRALMPVNTINLKSYIQARDKEINRIAVYICFLLIFLSNSLKAKANILLRFCFPHVFSVASWGTELLISHSRHNPKCLFTSQTGFNHWWTSANLRTVIALVAMFGKDLAASFAGYIYSIFSRAFNAANTIPISVGEIDSKFLATDRAGFGNVAPLYATWFTAKPGIPFGNFGRPQLKTLAADLTGESNPLPLGNASARRTTIQGIGATVADNVHFSADDTSLFAHDTIVSRVATQIQAEVYNFEVKTDHSYIADGFVVHNCMACVSLHGTRMELGETVDDHHQGRCDSVSVVQGREFDIQSGEDWFGGLDPERQQALMGPGAFEAWRNGEITLRDFVQPYHDPVFGQMIREASLRGMLSQSNRTVTTLGGEVMADRGRPGTTLESLTAFVENSNGPLAQAFNDFEHPLVGYDDNGTLFVRRDNVRDAARLFVSESQNFQYSRDYLVNLAQQQAAQNGLTLTPGQAESLMNRQYATQARAILTAADVGNVRLTEAQVNRLQTAIDGHYLDMVYSRQGSERGSLRNRIRETRATGIELEQARQNYRDWILGLD